MAEKHFESVDEYMKSLPHGTRETLEQVRMTIQKTLPGAAEKISYNIPVFTLGDKYVIYFSGYKEHISVYPRPHSDALKEKIEPYVHGKGTLQFQLDQPIPYDLIGQVAQALSQENHERTQQ
jgi:uncharacterized protein YdhG (YjbR/CyaY superfamily)